MRLLAVALCMAFAVGVFAADEAEVASAVKARGGRAVSFDDLAPGDYITVQFGPRPVAVKGLVERVKIDRILVDLSVSEEGLVGTATIKRGEIEGLWRLPSPTPSEIARYQEKAVEESSAARRGLEEYRGKVREEEGTPEEEEAGAPALAALGLTPEQIRLLTDFPPEQGWSLAKFNDIRRNWIIYDLPPTEKERLFLDVFPLWDDAYKALLQAGEGLAPPSSEEPLPGEKYLSPPPPERGTERGKVTTEAKEEVEVGEEVKEAIPEEPPR